MPGEIVFYHNPMSRGRIAHWMLEEVGQPYRTVILDLTKGEHKAQDYLRINALGKVPAIVHEDTVVTETAAICAYLADAFPAAGLAPSTHDPQRGTYFRWLFFGAGCLEPAISDKLLQRPEVERKSVLGYGSYEDTVDALADALAPGPWILGETFSAADVYVGSQIMYAMRFGAPGLKERAAFTNYAERLSARPAYIRANETDDKRLG
ncbi:glutathione S-transferase family protein [Microvirga massiliensis]|uniref:glutathione S-transferase family protein n=1 Tax=Microvirga massiliensis TaxID=1033741 RepID=UPI00062BEC5A|nr:glutathione S-transferase family protein [Microvirga massiliensis]